MTRLEDITYTVDEEDDGIFYVFDPDGHAIASYCDEDEAQEHADKLTSLIIVNQS